MENNSFDQFLCVVEGQPFYFGIGGIGDFLLLLSTFYEDLTEKTNVVFVANSVIPIKNVAKEFPLINVFIFPRNSFMMAASVWDKIKSMNCLGTGVTPKHFKYINEWNECGKTNVFVYYGVISPCKWFDRVESINPYVVLQPYGGSEDKTKAKLLSSKEIIEVCKEFSSKHMLVIGNKGEIEAFNKIATMNKIDTKFITTTSDINQAFAGIKNCVEFVGTDSWGKTLAALTGCKKIRVYQNIFPISPMELFGQMNDPGDNVFLKDWGFIYPKRNL